MRIHFIIHEAFEAPGAYETWAQGRGHTISYSRVYAGQALPVGVADLDWLIIMGGPQSPTTPQSECPHYHAEAEAALIRQGLAAGKVVLGICLGAQLIGHALGAAHEHSPEREIGNFPITLTPAGLAHPLFAHFGAMLESGHWHGDMPGLTPAAQVLATSAGCPRQIIAYAPRVYGLQCHLEFNPELVEGLIAASAAELATHHDRPFVQTPAQLRRNRYEAMNEALMGFLDRLAQQSQAA